MGIAQAHIPSIFEQLQSFYLIPEPEEVFAFVESHPILLTALDRTHDILKDFFTKEEFHLQIYLDRMGEFDPTLDIVVITDRKSQEFIDLMDKFDDVYDEIVRGLDSLLMVSFEYRY